jgi:twitching motility protein PilU
MRLFKEGTITLEEALQNSDSPNNLKLKINLSEGRGSATEGKDQSNAAGSLELQAIQKDEEEDSAEAI